MGMAKEPGKHAKRHCVCDKPRSSNPIAPLGDARDSRHRDEKSVTFQEQCYRGFARKSKKKPSGDGGLRKARAARTAATIMVLILGVALIAGPDFWKAFNQVQMSATIIQFDNMCNEIISDDGQEGQDTPGPAEAEVYKQAYDVLEDYNRSLIGPGGQTINDPFGFRDTSSLLEDLGISDGIIGYIDMPSIGVHLPLYLGASAENMAKGAAVISGTSVPLGQKDSNCVIAGHRGYSGAVFFRDIENAQIGDPLTVVTYWGKLGYRVVETRIIYPNDADALKIEPGRDMVTLFTCHPYPGNSQRYLLICERDDTVIDESEGSSSIVGSGNGVFSHQMSLISLGDYGKFFVHLLSGEASSLEIEHLAKLAGFILVAFLAISEFADAIKRRRKRNAQQPVKEDCRR